jgi:guanine deaminase
MPDPASLSAALPTRPPFAIRAGLLTPLAAGGTRHEPDALLEVDATGRIAAVSAFADRDRRGGRAGPGGASAGATPSTPIDLRPLLLLPGMVDLHAHLPQYPNAGLGAGIGLLPWLERYIFPLERDFDEAAAERLAPTFFRAMAATGTTTAVLYGAIFEPSLDATFRAAEAHGIRAVIGKVMMDRVTYDRLTPEQALEVSLRQSADLCERWHGRDDGRLAYAFTPRFAVACSAEMLKESARLAAHYGAYWQTHLAEDASEVAEVARLFPEARDYLDVYDRAGGLGPRTILAHAIHLSDREVSQLVESGSRIAHCPASNLFLGVGLMPLARYREAGATVGLGSDVAGGPELSMFSVMRAGAYVQGALGSQGETAVALDPLEWLRLATLESARALSIDAAVGSLEAGKEADLIAVDPSMSDPLPGAGAGEADRSDASNDPEEVMSRLIFRARPDMVRGAWVRGRLLDGAAPG